MKHPDSASPPTGVAMLTCFIFLIVRSLHREKQHGGYRPGVGRKPKYGTKTVVIHEPFTAFGNGT
jgi:hypothetical protein